MLGRERVVPGLCARKKRAGGKDRVARVWDKSHVTGVCQRCAHVTHTLLRAATAHDHGGRDALNAKAGAIVVADGLKQLVLVVQGVLPVGRVFGALSQRLDHVVRRLEVRRTNREVKHLATLCLELAALGIERGKDLVAKQAEPL